MTDISKKLTEERGKTYGHPRDDFERISSMARSLEVCSDPKVKHALYMILVNVSRLVQTPDHQDSVDDIKGYAETINMLHTKDGVPEDSESSWDCRMCRRNNVSLLSIARCEDPRCHMRNYLKMSYPTVERRSASDLLTNCLSCGSRDLTIEDIEKCSDSNANCPYASCKDMLKNYQAMMAILDADDAPLPPTTPPMLFACSACNKRGLTIEDIDECRESNNGCEFSHPMRI